jgi:sulfotransferase
MPRAGSELLQVLLHQNPTIYGSPTSPLLEYQFAARNNFELPEVKAQPAPLMRQAFNYLCAGMAQSYYDPITNRPIVCDKNRGWLHYYEWVKQWNPEPKMICMVRDLRSIVASFENVFRKTRHLPTGPDNPGKMENLTLDARTNYWLNSAPIGLALQRTFDIFQRKIADKILFIRYEDLISAPQETMGMIYSYTNEPEFFHNFSEIQKEVAEDCSHFGPYGNHEVKPQLSPGKPWTETLPRNVGAQIKNFAPWYFDQFNY